MVGSLYCAMYFMGSEVVARYAGGPLWLLMVAAPYVLAFLVLTPILAPFLQRIGEQNDA